MLNRSVLCVVKTICAPFGFVFLLWNLATINSTRAGCSSFSISSTSKRPPFNNTDSIAGAIAISFLVPSDSSASSIENIWLVPSLFWPWCIEVALTCPILRCVSELLEVSESTCMNCTSAALTSSGMFAGKSASSLISLLLISNFISSIPTSAAFA